MNPLLSAIIAMREYLNIKRAEFERNSALEDHETYKVRIRAECRLEELEALVGRRLASECEQIVAESRDGEATGSAPRSEKP